MSTITQLIFCQKAPHLEKITAPRKAEMKTSKMFLARIDLCSSQFYLVGLFFVGVSSVVTLFSAVPSSAMMWPRTVAFLLQKPC